MTHLSPGDPEPTTPSSLLSPSPTNSQPPRAIHCGLDREHLGAPIAERRRTLAELETALVAVCERAAARHAAPSVYIANRETWDKATWNRYLAAATRFEPDYMPPMRRLLSEIERLERLMTLPSTQADRSIAA